MTTSAEGLTTSEAAARLAEHGPNVVANGHRRSVVVELLLKFRNPLVLLLLGAATVAEISGDTRSFVVILVMVLLSVVLDFVQEHRAGRAAERLRQAASRPRGGPARRQPERRSADRGRPRRRRAAVGRQIWSRPTARLLEARDLFVNQALLTGEPFPVEKHAGAVPPGRTRRSCSSPSRHNAVFMGTSVVSGTAPCLVIETGAQTLPRPDRRLRSSASRRPRPSSRARARFGMLIMRLALSWCCSCCWSTRWRTARWLDSFLFAVALAVGLTPELLPMVVSVTLSRGAMRMSRRKVIVKRLAAIQDLGSMDVLCTDKTGTLTEARIRLEQHVDRAGPRQRAGAGAGVSQQPLRDGAARARSTRRSSRTRRWTSAGWTRSTRCRSTSSAAACPCWSRTEGAARCWSSRARPRTSCGCRRSYEDGGEVPARSTTRSRASLTARFEALGREGFRVLGIASKRAAPDVQRDRARATRASWCSPASRPSSTRPRQSAGEALRSLARAGVAVKIVTGDNELVAAARLRRAGPAGRRRADRRARSRRMDDHALRRARRSDDAVLPRHARRRRTAIILALQARAGTSSATSATASTTRPRCTPPTSASRSTARWTWRRRRPT